MNPIIDIIFGGYYISVLRKDSTRLYKISNRRHLRIIRIIQPELLAYMKAGAHYE